MAKPLRIDLELIETSELSSREDSSSWAERTHAENLGGSEDADDGER